MSGNGRLWGRMRLRVLQAQARISWKIFLFYRYHCFQGQVMWYFREGESFQRIRWAFFSLSIITMCSPLKDLSYQSLIEGMSEYRDLEPDSPELKFLGVFFFFPFWVILRTSFIFLVPPFPYLWNGKKNTHLFHIVWNLVRSYM